MKAPKTIPAKDLARQAPHSPRQRVGGFAIALRAADKCLAAEAGTPGEYHYDCPLDNLLFTFKKITGGQFREAVMAVKNHEEIGAWLHANGTPRADAEVRKWSDEMEASSPIKNPEKRAWFIENCARLGLNPEMNTFFDMLEADDRESFRRKPALLTV